MASKRLAPSELLPEEKPEKMLKCDTIIEQIFKQQDMLGQKLAELGEQINELQLRAAINEGNVKMAASLVRSGTDLSRRKYDNERSALHKVLMSYKIKNNVKREELVRLMLDHGADINAVDAYGDSILHYALYYKHCSSRLVEELLEGGARVSIDESLAENDIVIARYRKPELLPKLIQHQVPNEETRNQRGFIAIKNLISMETAHDELEIIKQILDIGVPVNTIRPIIATENEQRPCPHLCTALMHQNIDAAQLLLDYGADPHQKNDSGETPLYLATAIADNTLSSRWLIEKGASVHDGNDDGRYPIHGACLHESLENIHLFLSLGADLNVVDEVGCTPFNYMEIKEISEGNEAYCKIIKYLAFNVAKGKKVSDADIAKINQCDWSKRYFEECLKQLDRMKTEKIYGDVSYFQLFSRNMLSAVQLMNNQSFVRNFKRNGNKRSKLFPMYSHMLVHCFKIAERRHKILQTETVCIRNSFSKLLPELVIGKIAYYSSLELLKCCKHDYYMNLHATLKNTKVDIAQIQ